MRYEKFREQIKVIKKNKWTAALFLLFLLSTILFIYQHLTNLSWDFSSYVLNAKYLFYRGSYFEVYRPPMASLLLGFFLIFKNIGEYLYIVFVSSLFFYSSIKLSDIIFKKWLEDKNGKGINKHFVRFVFYFFSLSSFTLFYGLHVGTELLALAFFELFLAGFLKNRISGHYLALAFLSRYTFLIFFPLLFFNKDCKKILKNIICFLILVFPWLLFNYLKFGNWFTSIVDAYAMNIFLRSHLFEPFRFAQLFTVIGWFLPFFILGVIFALYEIFRFGRNWKDWFNLNKFYLLFFLIFFLIIFSYAKIPFKVVRYLFNLILPVAYFSTLSVLFLIEKSNKIKKLGEKPYKLKKIEKIILVIFLISFLVTSFNFFIFFNATKIYDNKFFEAANDIKKLGIEYCEILSPHWVLITYFTENTYSLGRNIIPKVLEEDRIVLIFYNEPTMDDIFDLNELGSYNKLHETEEYVFLTKDNFSINNCSKKYVFDETYINNHCEIMSKKFESIKIDKFVLRLCKKINKK